MRPIHSLLLPAVMFGLWSLAVIVAFASRWRGLKRALSEIATDLGAALSIAEGLSTRDEKVSKSTPDSVAYIRPELERGAGISRLFRPSWWLPVAAWEASLEDSISTTRQLRQVIEKIPKIAQSGPPTDTDQSRAPSSLRVVPRVPDRDSGSRSPTIRSAALERDDQSPPESEDFDAPYRPQGEAQRPTANIDQPTITKLNDPGLSWCAGLPADALLALYNDAVENRNLRGEFRGKFQPLLIATANAVERRRDPDLAPEFREASNGNFFAVRSEDQRDYLVLPAFDVAVKHTSFEAGAIGQIFDCPGYNPKLSYLYAKIRRPAIFEVSGQIWALRRRGQLDLGMGE